METPINAPVAEAPKPDQPSKPVEGSSTVEPETVIKKWAKTLDPQKLQIAKAAGLDVEFLINYLDAMEKVLNKQDAAMGSLLPLAEAVKQAKAQQATAPAAAPGAQGLGGLGSLIQFLPQIFGSGGSSDFAAELGKKAMETALENMNLGNLLLKGVIQKSFPDLVINAAAVVPKP